MVKDSTFKTVMLGSVLLLVAMFGWSNIKQSATEEVTTSIVTGQQGVRIGSAATVTALPYDIEANTKTLKTDVNLSLYKSDKVSAVKSYTGFSATADGDITTDVKTGGTYKVVAIDTSYNFMEGDVKTITMNTERESVELNVHAISTEAQMAWTCKDKWGTTLDAPVNSTRSDYNLTMGGDGTEQVKCYFKVDAADVSFSLGGFGLLYQNDIKKVTITSVKGTTITTRSSVGDKDYDLKEQKYETMERSGGVPLHMQSLTFTNGLNDTAWDKIVLLKTPILLNEWDEVEVVLSVESTSTDPSYTRSSSDMFAIIAKSWAPFESKDGSVKWDIADESATEADVGLGETDDKGFGKDTTVLIEVI